MSAKKLEHNKKPPELGESRFRNSDWHLAEFASAIETEIDDFDRTPGWQSGSLFEEPERTAAEILDELADSISKSRNVDDTVQEAVTATRQTDEQEQVPAIGQAVAFAAENLKASWEQVWQQVAASAVISEEAVIVADRTNVKVEELTAASQKISEVVTLIADIAAQTNLLALNATIEAARAGRAGKGFAVVAAEVKNLADQTAKATDKIDTQISSIQSAASDAVAAIQEVGATITHIHDISLTTDKAIENPADITQEIVRNTEDGSIDVFEKLTELQSNTSVTGQSASMFLTELENFRKLTRN